MKRIWSSILLVFFALPIMAQQGDVVLCEGFFNPWLEEGWDVKGDEWAVWYLSNTNYAGGKSREVQMYPDFNFEGTTRLVTPVVELGKYDFINFQFNHCFEATQGELNAQIGIGISHDGETWESIWEDTLTGSIEQSQYLLTFDMEEWSSKTPQFCLYFSGLGSYVNSWYIDNVIVFASKKNKFGKIDDSDETGFVAARSHILSLKGPKAGTVTRLGTMKKSKNKFSKIVEGRNGRRKR
ncbi:MAG: hypothetical protein IJP44_08565 [Bacteroidales bacterium]|nr:hypothetical protein [Bacteroidales bacterium]